MIRRRREMLAAVVVLLGFGGAQATSPARALASGSQFAAAARYPDAVAGDYWDATSAGVVTAHGAAPNEGSVTVSLSAPVVGMAATPDGKGYWMVGSDGGVFNFGDAPFEGSMGGQHLNAPIVGIAATPDGKGYWLVGADGGIFNFGDASFDGSMGDKALTAPIVGMAATPSGGGYWLVGSDGNIYTFGNAGSDGSMLGRTLPEPILGMASSPDGGGYQLFDGDGAVYDFGDFLPPTTSPPSPTPTPPTSTTPTTGAPAPLPTTHAHGRDVVRVVASLGWRWDRDTTELARIVVTRVSAGAEMTLSCQGRGCPRNARLRQVVGARSIRDRLLRLKGMRFRAGDRWSLTFSRRGWRSQRDEIIFRDGHAPRTEAVTTTRRHHRRASHSLRVPAQPSSVRMQSP